MPQATRRAAPAAAARLLHARCVFPSGQDMMSLTQSLSMCVRALICLCSQGKQWRLVSANLEYAILQGSPCSP